MATEEYITFQKFTDHGAALSLGLVLEEGNIEYELENASTSFDPFFTNNELTKEFRIKLKKEDFEKADKLLQQISLSQIDLVEKDYFLFDFTNEELVDVVSKKDEWGQFNFTLAQKILKERGKEIKPAEVESFTEQRIEELTKPEESQNWLITAGYVLILLGGLFGLFIGWHLATHKKTLPNGDRVYGYSLQDRKHGNIIVIGGAICFVFSALVAIAEL